jgi:arabinan endo-1,5-alpha-L-arabinosidase
MHDKGRDLIVYHAYDAENKAAPTLRISELHWDADGWPSVDM